MTYKAAYRGKVLASDQAYLVNITGDREAGFSYTDLIPIDSNTLNEQPFGYHYDYYVIELELGETAISVTSSMTKGTGSLLYSRAVYTGDFNYDRQGNLSGGLVREIHGGSQSEVFRLKFLGEDLYPGQRPIRITTLEDLDKDLLAGYSYGRTGSLEEFFPGGLGWHNNPWGDNIIGATAQSSRDSAQSANGNAYHLQKPGQYKKSHADIITNYNSRTDGAIQIDLGTFDGAIGKLQIAKKSSKVAKLAKKKIDFILDRQAGYLYYNENGKQPGFGDGGIFAILEGNPKVGMENFEFM